MSYPYQNNQYLQNLMLPQQRQPYNVTEVNGKNGVDAFCMPPNSSDLLLDTTAPIVWLVKTDGAGYKTMLLENRLQDTQIALQNEQNKSINAEQSAYLLSVMGKWVANAPATA